MPNIQTPTTGAFAATLKVIRELASQGHTVRDIAVHLDSARMPRLTLRATAWHPASVWKLMRRYGVAPAR